MSTRTQKGNSFEGIFGGSNYHRFAKWFGMGPQFYRRGIGNLSLTADMRALDLGCGTGSLSFALAEKSNAGAEIVGVDISKDQIAFARRHADAFACSLSFQLRSMDETGFPDGHFDLVMTSMALHETPPEVRRGAIAEAGRVLKPGGRFLLVDISRPRFGIWGLLFGSAIAFSASKKDCWNNVYPALCREHGMKLAEDAYLNSIARRQLFIRD